MKIGNPTHQLLKADPSHWVGLDWWIGALLILLSCGEASSSSPVRASLSRVGENHVNFLEFLSVICSMYLEIWKSSGWLGFYKKIVEEGWERGRC